MCQIKSILFNSISYEPHSVASVCILIGHTHATWPFLAVREPERGTFYAGTMQSSINLASFTKEERANGSRAGNKQCLPQFSPSQRRGLPAQGRQQDSYGLPASLSSPAIQLWPKLSKYHLANKSQAANCIVTQVFVSSAATVSYLGTARGTQEAAVRKASKSWHFLVGKKDNNKHSMIKCSDAR